MDLRRKADEIRLKTFETSTHAGGGHYGGSLSAIEIMTVLYYDIMNIDKDHMHDDARDRFVLCKGHAGPPLYAVLADRGFFPAEWLLELDADGGHLPKHVDRKKVPGIEFSSGPLGQGLSVACGMALPLLHRQPDARVYALLGDGECDEGQVWEAAMLAAHYQLGNLIAIVDYNKCQIDGAVSRVMGLEPLADKWAAFGWNVLEADGHDVDALHDVLTSAKRHTGSPTVILAHTKKGHGVSFMEGNYLWHSGKITAEQFETGRKELESACRR